MKILINKANPEIRITAPDITLENHCYYIWTDDGDCIIEFWEKDWTLVEEKPEKQTSKYLKEPDYDKQVVEKMSKELAKIITDQIVEPVDLEKEIEKAQEHYFALKDKGFSLDSMDVSVLARHFYELGRKGGSK